MEDVGELLKLDTEGRAVHQDPLTRWRFRFDPRTGAWMRVTLRKVGMPRRVSRLLVAQETGATEDSLRAWEGAMKAALPAEEKDALLLLQLTSEGRPVHRDPLVKWRFQFFPQVGRWRRATASRDEVPSEAVAKKVGVPVEVLKAWEAARSAMLEAEE